uniref:Uncharacterized protein n=1 Tax=Romanomermis culicivorax TaxID=13658 RepID=A0A915IB78_ROMCU
MEYIAEFMKGRLPWSRKRDMLEINLIKLMNEKDLSDGLSEQMKQICKSLYKLKYEDRPDYESYRSRLLEILVKKRYLIKAPYDWEKGTENCQLYARLFERFR